MSLCLLLRAFDNSLNFLFCSESSMLHFPFHSLFLSNQISFFSVQQRFDRMLTQEHVHTFLVKHTLWIILSFIVLISLLNFMRITAYRETSEATS